MTPEGRPGRLTGKFLLLKIVQSATSKRLSRRIERSITLGRWVAILAELRGTALVRGRAPEGGLLVCIQNFYKVDRTPDD